MSPSEPVNPAEDPYVSLATFRKSGVAVRTPVWVAQLGEHGFVFSEGQAGKVKRIRNNQQVQLATCNYRGDILGDWYDGTARRVDDPALIRQVYGRFAEKYGWQYKLLSLLSKLGGKYDKRAVIEITVTGPAREANA